MAKEQEIRWKDLFTHFLSRWKSILTVTVLCTLILGGWQFFSVKKIHDAGEKTKEEARYEQELSEFETNLANIQGDVNYLTQIWQERVTYRNNSLLMNLDPNNLWIAEKKYRVSGADESSADILAVYTGAMKTDHEKAEILEAFGTENAGYARELVKIVADAEENSFTVTVLASEREKAEKGLAYVSEKIEKAEKRAQEIGSHTLKVLSEGSSESVREDLITKQSTLANEIANHEDDITRAKRSLTNVQESKPYNPGDPVVRWAVTGGVLGFVLMIAIYLTTFLRKKGSLGSGSSDPNR